MIKYYKELENRKDYYLPLIKRYYPHTKIIFPCYLKEEYLSLINKVFKTINSHDIIGNAYLQDGIDVFSKNYDESINTFTILKEITHEYMIYDETISERLTPQGRVVMNYIYHEFTKYHDKKDKDYLRDLRHYFASALSILFFDMQGINNINNIVIYLRQSMVLLEEQHKLTPELKQTINKLISLINNYVIKIDLPATEPVNCTLPDMWFITPNKYLYNPTGPFSGPNEAHKNANLCLPMREIYREEEIDIGKHKEHLLHTLKQGYITAREYSIYVNLPYDIVSLPIFDEDKISDYLEARTYNPRVFDIVVGIQSAHLGLYQFFNDLKKECRDYHECINDIRYFINRNNFDDFLVRFCGFHKITCMEEKTIVTSCVNYEEEFSEYIKNGWRIDFTPPIIYDRETDSFKEYNEEFLVIRQLLKNIV